MKILFIANPVANLYKEIEAEMILQGHEVKTLINQNLRFDPAEKNRVKIPILKSFLWKLMVKRYWEDKYRILPDLNERYDCLFVISGNAVTKDMVEHMKSKNPNLLTVFYTWDGCRYYDYARHLTYMDKCYTFDIEDYKRDSRWKLLPIFFKKNTTISDTIIKYDLFSVGSNHDGRYSFIKKILPQLEGYNYYIRIVSPVIKLTFLRRLYLLTNRSIRKQRMEEIAFSEGNYDSNILLRDNIPYSKYMDLMMESNCILDDTRDGQTGLSARFMWALGSQKKIITTNSWAYDYEFVEKDQVCIVSKENPIIPHSFLKPDNSNVRWSKVENYEISNWVKEILN